VNEPRQTVAGAYDKIEAHEELCAERLKNLHGRINLLFAVIGAAATMAAAAGGWAFNKVYESQQQQLMALQHVSDRIGH
jgi:hypothetical protein